MQHLNRKALQAHIEDLLADPAALALPDFMALSCVHEASIEGCDLAQVQHEADLAGLDLAPFVYDDGAHDFEFEQNPER